jgi:hypothetical protein
MKLYRTILYFCLLIPIYHILFTIPIFAQSKNIFGLHLTQTGDIDSASKIINSSGGDWGYLTIVIRLDQLNHQTWQEFFDKCRKYHLIPIVRLASIMEKDHWKRPERSDIDSLASFLNSLNWPTKDQHIILFNEINHASEWGGSTDINSFADIAIYTSQKLKQLNSNFIILSSPLDLAAPDKGTEYMSASSVYKEIYKLRPEYFDHIDALASHSYPNHGYVGLPTDTGQHSIRGYIWEQKFINSLGVGKTYPVYITETGWPHREGESKNNQYYTADTTANLLIKALKIWQNDSQIVAVTPFIYNFPHPPFDHFSWLNKDEKLIPAYQKIIELSKEKNIPAQNNSYEIISNRLPFIILTDTEYLGEITLKNTGQAIWGETSFCLAPDSTTNVVVEQICTSGTKVYPNDTEKFAYKFSINRNTPESSDKSFISWKNLPPLEITPLNGAGTIYSPKTTIKQKIIQYFQSWFI